MDYIGFEENRAKFKKLLTTSFFDKNIESLNSAFNEVNCNDADKKSAMDQAFRDKLLELLVEKPESLDAYVCFCIESCRLHIVTPTMPVVLLGDIFDALTLDKCEKMFAYVEKGVHIWKEDLFFVACKNNLLRMCNDLLRRLSRSQNTVFCGRILLFLAKFFPFSERSGLNIVSEFNLENLTEFGGENSGNLQDCLIAEEESVIGDNKTRLTIDYNLYCKFWALQEFFRNPNLCYNKVQWKTFASHSLSVLSAFGSYKLEVVEMQKSKLNLNRMVVDGEVQIGDASKEQHYFAKFLTNQKLLELQLSDSNFRRCVLVQFLILFQYLNCSVKFKLEVHELKTDQNDWVRDTTSLIYKLLGETPPDGKAFAECVRHILKREEHWNSWKNEGCPEFQKPKPSVQIASDISSSEDGVRKIKTRRKRLLGDIIKDYEGQGKFYMGNPELTKLWNLCPDNLGACQNKDRDFMPSLESYLGVGGEALSPRRTGDSAWGWRALRLLARRSPHFFTYSNNPIGRLPEYLDAMVRRVTREISNADDVSGIAGNFDASVDNKVGVKVDGNDEEVSEEQMEEDLMKSVDPDDVEQLPDTKIKSEMIELETNKSHSRVTMITPEQLDAVCDKLQSNWKKLAGKLGYKVDEILYFATENDNDHSRAKNMLQLWFEGDEDASVENLVYIMEGLELVAACDVLKPACGN